MTHIGILQCDKVRPEHQKKHPDYPDMFVELLSAETTNITFTTFCCIDGEFPETTHSCDGWIITGSKHGCCENLPWMLKLEDFIRSLYIDEVPCIGVCFGHQIMAQALGGSIKKSTKGWGIGVTTTDVYRQVPWTYPFKNQLNILVSHQDQISKLPESAEIIAGCDFCPYFILTYGQHFMSIQGHPEFTKGYETALIETRAACIGDTCKENALASLDKPVDSALFATWMLTFFRQAT